jgi:hypothetical protein
MPLREAAFSHEGGLQRHKAVFSSFKIPKKLQDFPSHQIFGRMHEALNLGKKNN